MADPLYGDPLRPGAVRRCRLLRRRYLTTGDLQALTASLRLARWWSIGLVELS